MKNTQGFSFIEISVVLAIMGLLLAAVMSGAHLLEVARLNSVITDAAQIKSSLESYEARYGALPGDMPNANDFWPNSAGYCPAVVGPPAHGCEGDGDGRIEYSASVYEDVRLWQHLSLSEYYPGDFTGDVIDASTRFGIETNAPGSQRNGVGFWVMYPTGSESYYGVTGNLIMVGGINSTTGELDAAGFTPEQADALDAKADDGALDAGEVFIGRGSDKTDAECTDGTAPVGNFTAATASMNFSDYTESCALIFWINKD